MNKKYIIVLSVLGVLFGGSLLVGISYAYYIVNVSQTNKNIVKSSCLNLSISNEENVIKLEKQIPIMNEEGKKLTPYTFTINNTCNSMMGYSLNLEELEGSTLSSKYIMTMINSKAYINMASLSFADNYYANSVESRVLATGSLRPNASINYSLRLWMDEATPLTSEAMNKSFRSKVVVVATPTKSVNFDYTGTEQVFIAPADGKYKIELWGAGAGSFAGEFLSYGSYVSGTINFAKGQKIYVYVGENGYAKLSNPAAVNLRFNGGGYGNLVCYKHYLKHENNNNKGVDFAGGGATDIRLANGDWDVFDSLKSRIIVAAGSGGIDNSTRYAPSNGGGLFSDNGGYYGSADYMATGATQVSPGTANGKFGVGGYAIYGGDSCSVNDGGGGGGGYYGGGGSKTASNVSQASTGAGGSSYISGHNGCDAIKEESTEDNIIHTGQSIHYSGMYFTDTVMIDGSGYKWTTQKGEYTGMPSHDGTGTMKGNAGNGYARITYIG